MATNSHRGIGILDADVLVVVATRLANLLFARYAPGKRTAQAMNNAEALFPDFGNLF